MSQWDSERMHGSNSETFHTVVCNTQGKFLYHTLVMDMTEYDFSSYLN